MIRPSAETLYLQERDSCRRNDRRIAAIAVPDLGVDHRACRIEIDICLRRTSGRTQHLRILGAGDRAVAARRGVARLGRQAVVVLDRALGERCHHVGTADRFHLGIEIVEDELDETLGFVARELRNLFGPDRPIGAVYAVDRTDDGHDRERCAARRNLARTHQRRTRGALVLALRSELALGLFARLALESLGTTRLDHATEHVVRELDPTHVKPLFDT